MRQPMNFGIRHSLRKAVSLWMALSLILMLVPVTATAGGFPVTVEIESSSGAPGDTLPVAVYMEPNDYPFWKYSLSLTYDSSRLELLTLPVDEAASGSGIVVIADEPGVLTFEANNFGVGLFVTELQKMATLNFTVKEGAAAGDADIGIASAAYTDDVTPIEIDSEDITPGKITVVRPADTVALTIGSAQGKAGDTVSVPVTVTQASAGIAAYGLQIDFDATALEAVSVNGASSGQIFESRIDNADGLVKAAWADGEGGEKTIQSGELLNIQFKIKSGATTGVKTLTVVETDVMNFTFTNESLDEFTKTLTPGKITVLANDDSNPTSPSGGSTTTATPPVSTGAEVIVNGKVQNAGTATTTTVNNRKVTTVVVDPAKLDELLKAEGNKAVVTIPVTTDAEVAVGELNGQMVKNMEQHEAVVEIRTALATYTLPAGLIDIDALSARFGASGTMQDIKIQIEVAKPTEEAVNAARDAAAAGGYTIVAPPLQFTVKATYGGSTVEVAQFSGYVQRTITLPDGVDPNQITTGVVVDPDGTVRHVPTRVTESDGRYYADVNSVTNSAYAVVWNPQQFKDVASHWSKDAVNDMASRMIVKGIGNGTFQPDLNVTRAEFAQIVVNGLGLKPVTGTGTFKDVKAADWYAGAVQTAYAYGLIGGFGDGTFRPKEPITREQAMTIIAKAMAVTDLSAQLEPAAGGQLAQFRDAGDVSAWAQSGVTDSLRAGLVTGRSDNQLVPQATITRAEAAVLVRRLLQKSGLI